jgi:hypothetical protein
LLARAIECLTHMIVSSCHCLVIGEVMPKIEWYVEADVPKATLPLHVWITCIARHPLENDSYVERNVVLQREPGRGPNATN